MKVIGILTENPRTYYEMLVALRDEGLRHVSLDFSEPLPANLSVVITTAEERCHVPFDKVITDADPDVAMMKVKEVLACEGETDDLTIGIDPGNRPGIAVLSHGSVLTRTLAPTPEAVAAIVKETIDRHAPSRVTIRLGNGDRTNRNRIFNALWDSGYVGEMVDERNTTRKSKTPDEDAAVEIALTPGYLPKKRQRVAPGPGEIRNVQRLSRVHSEGELTVSRKLAAKVALGEISMDEAVQMQKCARHSDL
ncbi:MAG: hypothetical protein JSV94_00250 [Methanobacteriota archaeon]|nr:MAG: hypothetical protein JSV94_00250 [Euryarchaeota archaeon]